MAVKNPLSSQSSLPLACTHRYTHTRTPSLVKQTVNVWLCQLCELDLGVGCIQLSDRLHSVYTRSHKQNLQRKH